MRACSTGGEWQHSTPQLGGGIGLIYRALVVFVEDSLHVLLLGQGTVVVKCDGLLFESPFASRGTAFKQLGGGASEQADLLLTSLVNHSCVAPD